MAQVWHGGPDLCHSGITLPDTRITQPGGRSQATARC